MSSKRPIFYIGDPVPDFCCASSVNPEFNFSTVAGRYVVLSFLGSSKDIKIQKVLECITGKLAHHFDINRKIFFAVTSDPDDKEFFKHNYPESDGVRYFWDFDKHVSDLYGRITHDGNSKITSYEPMTFVLDPMLRVIGYYPITDATIHNERLEKLLNALPKVNDHAGVPVTAPVLILPRVFERDFCQELVDLYQKYGGKDSGFMREKDGYTMGVLDYSFKRRKDFNLEHHSELEPVCSKIRARINRRLVPEIFKAFQFKVTHIERYIIACYEGENRGFFHAHRDNTSKGTLHRKFAVTINLNSEDYEGGDLRFPEFGTHKYRAPTGGAVVFSCSLLHSANPVTKGTRYAFLPFLYDAQSAVVRMENKKYIVNDIAKND